ncbi:hypothetical protein V1477_006162 [Vespula maculifrons]|uniref:Uncharacterized protein n=1 Tax=Vespula maculifrons TaxID=7453 RepID=A0ABD2CKF3_VESMC
MGSMVKTVNNFTVSALKNLLRKRELTMMEIVSKDDRNGSNETKLLISLELKGRTSKWFRIELSSHTCQWKMDVRLFPQQNEKTSKDNYIVDGIPDIFISDLARLHRFRTIDSRFSENIRASNAKIEDVAELHS